MIGRSAVDISTNISTPAPIAISVMAPAYGRAKSRTLRPLRSNRPACCPRGCARRDAGARHPGTQQGRVRAIAVVDEDEPEHEARRGDPDATQATVGDLARDDARADDAPHAALHRVPDRLVRAELHRHAGRLPRATCRRLPAHARPFVGVSDRCILRPAIRHSPRNPLTRRLSGLYVRAERQEGRCRVATVEETRYREPCSCRLPFSSLCALRRRQDLHVRHVRYVRTRAMFVRSLRRPTWSSRSSLRRVRVLG
jgi:hypothetical protein